MDRLSNHHKSWYTYSVHVWEEVCQSILRLTHRVVPQIPKTHTSKPGGQHFIQFGACALGASMNQNGLLIIMCFLTGNDVQMLHKKYDPNRPGTNSQKK